MPRRRKRKRYRIRTVSDLFAIPPEKLGQCMRALQGAIERRRAMADSLLTQTCEPPDEIVWIDNDRHDIYAVIKPAPVR